MRDFLVGLLNICAKFRLIQGRFATLPVRHQTFRYHLRRFATWTVRYLDSSLPGEFATWTFRTCWRLDTWTFR